jgi:acetylornithine deacetylase/succinyl-diaminopimelate desuccinylase-like protein
VDGVRHRPRAGDALVDGGGRGAAGSWRPPAGDAGRGDGARRGRGGEADPLRPGRTGRTCAARRAFAEAYGAAVVESGLGGSIPFIAEFARTFPGAAVLVTGVGDPASRWHGIDESLHLEMFGRAVLAEALLLAELA